MELYTWLCVNELALNPDKTDAIVFGTHRRSKLQALTDSINVAGVVIQPSNQFNVLGVLLDEKLTFTAHMGALCKSIYFHIRALRHIRHTLSTDDAMTVASALVWFSSRLC